MELLLLQNDAKMRYRHIILVHMVAVLLWLESLPHIDYYQLMIVELISDVLTILCYFLASDCALVELPGLFHGMRGYGHRERADRHVPSGKDMFLIIYNTEMSINLSITQHRSTYMNVGQHV